MVLGVSRFNLNVDLVANPLGLTEDAIYHHELDLSQDMLGRLLGKTGQTVARWEKGRCRIDGSAVRLLRAYYEAKVGRRPNKVTGLLERLAEVDGEDTGYPVEFALEDMDGGKWKVHDAA